MSVINFSKSLPKDGHDKYIIAEWAGLGNGDSGEPIALAQFSDRSVQVIGTFGGGSCVIEGSIDGDNYATLSSPDGANLSFSTSKVKAVTELVRYVRPVVTGDGTTSLSVFLLMRLS